MQITTENKTSRLLKILQRISVILCLFVPYTCSIFASLMGKFLRSGDVYLIAIAFIALCVLLRHSSKIYIRRNTFITLLLFLLPISSMLLKGIEIQNEFLQYSMALLFVLIFVNYDDWQEFTINFIEAMGVFYSVTVILQIIMPTAFNLFALTLLPIDGMYSYNLLRSNGYACGLTSQSSIVCCYISFGLFSIISKIIYAKNIGKKISLFQLAKLVVMVVALLLTGKRGHLIFTVFAYLVLLYVLTNNKPSKRLKLIFSIVFVLAIVYVLYVNLWADSDLQIMNSMDRIFGADSVASALNGRSEYYDIMLNLISRNPVTGIGWEHFRNYSGSGNNGHNIYLQLLTELGVIGGVLFILLLGLILLRTIKSLKIVIQNGSTNENSRITLLYFSIVSQVFFVTYGITGNPLYDTEYIGMLMIIITLSIYSQKIVMER